MYTANQTRLYVLEVIGLALALMATVGLALLFYRRLTNARVNAVTSELDWVLLFVLLLQVGLGFWVAYYYRWGSDWYLHTAVPWLVSLLKFQPNITYVAALPFWVKFHFVGGFVIVLLLPFTRLVHLLVYPISYLWCEHQVVIWNRSRMG
jgi:nitrate reductase gamma subunit